MPDQHPVEMILIRQLAGYLVLPIWLMDGDGNLVFYNSPAEALLGARFDDVGPIKAEELAEIFMTTTIGDSRPDDAIPVLRAFESRRPAHGEVRFRGLDEVWREVEVAAIPLEGHAGELLGVCAIFWEIEA